MMKLNRSIGAGTDGGDPGSAFGGTIFRDCSDASDSEESSSQSRSGSGDSSESEEERKSDPRLKRAVAAAARNLSQRNA